MNNTDLNKNIARLATRADSSYFRINRFIRVIFKAKVVLKKMERKLIQCGNL